MRMKKLASALFGVRERRIEMRTHGMSTRTVGTIHYLISFPQELIFAFVFENVSL